MKYCTDLILGMAFCIFIFFHFPDSRLSVLNGLHLCFWWHDSENQVEGTSKAFSEFVGEGLNKLTTLGSPPKRSCFWFKSEEQNKILLYITLTCSNVFP